MYYDICRIPNEVTTGMMSQTTHRKVLEVTPHYRTGEGRIREYKLSDMYTQYLNQSLLKLLATLWFNGFITWNLT